MHLFINNSALNQPATPASNLPIIFRHLDIVIRYQNGRANGARCILLSASKLQRNQRHREFTLANAENRYMERER